MEASIDEWANIRKVLQHMSLDDKHASERKEGQLPSPPGPPPMMTIPRSHASDVRKGGQLPSPPGPPPMLTIPRSGVVLLLSGVRPQNCDDVDPGAADDDGSWQQPAMTIPEQPTMSIPEQPTMSIPEQPTMYVDPGAADDDRCSGRCSGRCASGHAPASSRPPCHLEGGEGRLEAGACP